MHQIQLNDQLYQQVQRRATEVGFGSVDEYVADILQQELETGSQSLDEFFTPARLAHMDRAAAQIDSGQGIPAEQVRAHFRQKRDA